MAEVAALEQPTLKGDTIPPSPTQKRKRGTESASPESRRSKRGVAAANMQVANGEAPDQQVYLDSAMAAAHPPPDNLTDADFSALQQATVDHNDVSDPANASSTAAAALGSMYPTLHVPQATEETFVSHTGVEPEHSEAPFNVTNDGLPMDTSALENIQQPSPPNGVRQDLPRYPQAQKPAVGSEEWHKLRKDNHKEVERRRRETINEGINELAKIVPGCEKNKGSILQRSVAFITQLKENEAQNIEKWTLEKLLTEQAIAELSQSNDKLKTECERLYRELESWKRVAQAAGLSPDGKDETGTS